MSRYTAKLLASAGWSENRFLEFKTSMQPQNKAEEIGFDLLHSYGGLNVGEIGTGQESAASNVCFLAEPSRNKLHAVAHKIEKTGSLCAIADAHNEHMIVYVGCDGTCFIFTDPDEKLYSTGLTIEETLEHLLLGIDIQPSGLGIEI